MIARLLNVETRLFLAGAGLVLAVSLPAQAQTSMGSREFQQAELTEVSPAIRAEVERRATGGNTVRGVLETMLLNEISGRWPGSRIIAVDMGRGVAAIGLPDNSLRAVQFNKQDGLRVVAEVTPVR